MGVLEEQLRLAGVPQRRAEESVIDLRGKDGWQKRGIGSAPEDAKQCAAAKTLLAKEPELKKVRDDIESRLLDLKKLIEGAELVLDLIDFDGRARQADLVVTGEGTVDLTTLEGKAPGAVARRCERLGVRCELFGGVVEEGVRAHALSGRRARAGEDLMRLGEELARGLVELG